MEGREHDIPTPLPRLTVTPTAASIDTSMEIPIETRIDSPIEASIIDEELAFEEPAKVVKVDEDLNVEF